MSLPGFTAHASLSQTKMHYSSARAFGRFGRVIPQQLSSTIWGSPMPFCGPCHWSGTGSCSRECNICTGPLPDGCHTLTISCAPDECPPCGACICTSNCGGVALPCIPDLPSLS
jgi:hypothetical protein